VEKHPAIAHVFSMGKKPFTYNLYSATKGEKRFWRWEIGRHQSSKFLRSGVLYGTENEARDQANHAIAELIDPQHRIDALLQSSKKFISRSGDSSM
jgi:hypothetical protein